MVKDLDFENKVKILQSRIMTLQSNWYNLYLDKLTLEAQNKDAFKNQISINDQKMLSVETSFEVLNKEWESLKAGVKDGK